MNEVIRAAADLQAVCASNGWRYCFIGGLAVLRWGEPRETVDVDLTLVTGFVDEAEYVSKLMARFEPRIDHAADFVSEGYFAAVGLQFVAGGPPGPDQPTAAVITEGVARQYFDGRMPIGERLRNDDIGVPIVGVVRDVRARGLSQSPRPTVYETGHTYFGAIAATTYVMRAADTARASEWERIVTAVDPMAVVMDSSAIGERLDRSVRDRTFAALVIGLFALASVLVTTLGLAGIVAYTVIKRTRELAIRLALGATGSNVTRLVVRETLFAGACGVIGGIVASIWLSRTLESLLYDVRPADPATLTLTAVVLLGIVLAAALLPATRATHIQPATALRSE